MDPVDHDLFVHHITQRPVLGTLVSPYRAGEFMGVLAKSWTVSSDKRVWKFKLREGLRFEDGSPLTPVDVKRSLTRMAFLMRKANSKSGLLENMAGYNEVDSPGADFAGIATSMDSVEFRCLDVPTQFLEKLGFGLYSVVHKNDYNLETGAWNDPKKAISSGPYRILSWTDEHLELKLRSDFPPDVFTNKKFETVRLVWGNNKDAHLYAGDSLTPPLRESLVFSGGAKNRIQYLRIVSWPNSQIITSDIEFRKDFRNAFYEELKALKFAPVLSFLPLAISGVKEFQLPTRKSTPYPKKIIRLADSRNRGDGGPPLWRQWRKLQLNLEWRFSMFHLNWPWQPQTMTPMLLPTTTTSR